MTLQDIYDQLSFGELRMLFLGGADIDSPSEGMPKEQFQRLLPSVYLGLTELHKRFFLREGRFKIELQEDQTFYTLSSKYAQSNASSQAAVKYINDSEDPFTDNMFKVEHIWGTLNEEPFEIPLNEAARMGAIHTPTMSSIRVPTDPEIAPWLEETTELEVVYRADHPRIDKYVANAAPLITEISLPATHLEALCFYVASRLHNPIGMTPGAMHEGNNYFQRFLESVATLKTGGYEIDQDDDNDRFESRGFC